MTAGPPDELEAELAGRREALLERAASLVGFDTQNPPGNTAAVVDRLEATLADLGLDVDQYAVDPAKPNLVATLPGAGDGALCFLGHVDTVPYDPDGWSRDPLGEVDGDRLYGRGATDMKGTVAAMVETARAYVATGTDPPVALRFAFVSDEETGGTAGLGSLLAADRLSADACVVGETTCEAGRHSVTVADRGSIWLALEAEGRAAHGSRPVLGVNAVDRLYDAIATIRARFGDRRLDLDAEVSAIVEESVEYYGSSIGADAARALFERPTINLGTFEGGEAINTVPATARAGLDVRVTASVDTAALLAAIRECVTDCEGVTLTDVSWSVGTYEPPDSPFVEAVVRTADAVTGERIYRRSATGGGDAKKLRTAGVPTVEFALGTDTAHAVDEYTTLPALLDTARVYARLPYAHVDGRTAAGR